MSATTPALTEDATKRRDALVERLFTAAINTLEIGSVHIGGRLGFYRALADGGDATPAELAARTGTAERYVREWLEQQACTRSRSPSSSRVAGSPGAPTTCLLLQSRSPWG